MNRRETEGMNEFSVTACATLADLHQVFSVSPRSCHRARLQFSYVNGKLDTLAGLKV